MLRIPDEIPQDFRARWVHKTNMLGFGPDYPFADLSGTGKGDQEGKPRKGIQFRKIRGGEDPHFTGKGDLR